MLSRKKIQKALLVKIIRVERIMKTRAFLVSAICLFILVGAFPITHELTEEIPVQFSTEYKNENGLELGVNKVAQEGREGQRRIKYTYTQSLFDRWFGGNKIEKVETENVITSKPKDKIVLKGTRKWQYMMCSDGSYRYFTDEQFKASHIGFTSKSPDYCAENKQGKKISLADSPAGNNNTIRPTYVPPSCSIIDIPYKTVYQDADWLYIGETQDGYGVNGFKYVCSDGSYNSSYAPINKIVYRGTKVRETYTPAPTTSSPDYAAKYKCDSDYNSAKAQLAMHGASGGSAMQQIQYLYQQCLRNAGF